MEGELQELRAALRGSGRDPVASRSVQPLGQQTDAQQQVLSSSSYTLTPTLECPLFNPIVPFFNLIVALKKIAKV